jgi:hypothetical protein
MVEQLDEISEIEPVADAIAQPGTVCRPQPKRSDFACIFKDRVVNFTPVSVSCVSQPDACPDFSQNSSLSSGRR